MAADRGLREEIANFSETIKEATLLIGKLVVESEKTEKGPESDSEPQKDPKPEASA